MSQFSELFNTMIYNQFGGWWFVQSLGEVTTPIIYKGDVHKNNGWQCSLQHRWGGRLCQGFGPSPEEAMSKAVEKIKDGIKNQVWGKDDRAQ